MNPKSRWLVGLALAAALAGTSASYVTAAEVQYWASGQTITVEPKMNFIPNTDVYYQRRAPGYDLYRYANRWYLVDEGNWYRADTWRGPFRLIEFSEAPEAVTTIPETFQGHWVAGHPRDRGRDASEGSWASERIITKKPKMSRITSGGVTYASRIADFDLYRYRGTWYLMEDGVWYSSTSWKGPFMSLRAKSVPSEVTNVPSAYRRHWTAPAS
jgi:hypothetical protein